MIARSHSAGRNGGPRGYRNRRLPPPSATDTIETAYTAGIARSARVSAADPGRLHGLGSASWSRSHADRNTAHTGTATAVVNPGSHGSCVGQRGAVASRTGAAGANGGVGGYSGWVAPGRAVLPPPRATRRGGHDRSPPPEGVPAN